MSGVIFSSSAGKGKWSTWEGWERAMRNWEAGEVKIFDYKSETEVTVDRIVKPEEEYGKQLPADVFRIVITAKKSFTGVSYAAPTCFCPMPSSSPARAGRAFPSRYRP